MKRILVFLIILSGCTAKKQSIKPPPDLPQKMIEKLEEGFNFTWTIKREKSGTITTLNASGSYEGENNYSIKGKIRMNGTEENIRGINPYSEILNVTGIKDFKYLSGKNENIKYSFKANLTLLSPGGMKGKGEIWIDKNGVKKIKATASGMEWEMEIEPLADIPRKSVKIPDKRNHVIMVKRIKHYGERDVEVKDSRIYYREMIPLREEGLLFDKGDFSVFSIKHVPEGKFLLSPDSIEQYDPLDKKDVKISNVEYRKGEKKGYTITVHFDRPLEEKLLGILIDNQLFGIGHPQGATMRFTVKDDVLSREIYAILKAHSKEIR